MKTFRFTIPCLDGKRRFVFCRSLNSVDARPTGTGTAIVATDSKARAFVAYGAEQAASNLAYFREHSRGLDVQLA